jgi:hypothetical protein
MKYKILITLSILTFVALNVILAQGPGGPPPPPRIPIDGGALLLLGAGAAYGYKKIRESRVKHQEQKD